MRLARNNLTFSEFHWDAQNIQGAAFQLYSGRYWKKQKQKKENIEPYIAFI